MDRPHFLKSIVDWLREGYPNGIPSGDYVPLVALLRRRLTDDEVKQITRDLISQQQSGTEPPRNDRPDDLAPISKIDAGVEVTKAIDELPSESDIERIRERLERKGWPFDDEPFGGEGAEHGPPTDRDDRDGESGQS